jgi:hypothetical protein
VEWVELVDEGWLGRRLLCSAVFTIYTGYGPRG